MESASPRYESSYSLVITRAGSRSAETRCAWESLISSAKNVGTLAESPPYFDLLHDSGEPGRLALAQVRNGTGAIVGIVPLLVEPVFLRFDLSGYVLAETGSKGVTILGSLALLPPRPSVYNLFFKKLSEEFPDCGMIALKGVSTTTPFWDYLQQSRWLREVFDVYLPDAVRYCHMIPLPASYDLYVSRFNAKRRYNMRRQRRLLRDHGAGRLELERFDSTEQLPELIEIVRELGGVVAPARRGLMQSPYAPLVSDVELKGLAKRGLLLSYVLSHGGRPCAAALGMVHGRIYYLNSLLRDRTLDRFSPGTTLLDLLVEDLIHRGAVDLIDFGFGEPCYRHSATNVTEARAPVLLMRPTTPNRIRRRAHSAFKGFVEGVKAVVRGR
jgi:CelD/BcsL family acetyltransferase involved in cellulose biosynthesis